MEKTGALCHPDVWGAVSVCGCSYFVPRRVTCEVLTQLVIRGRRDKQTTIFQFFEDYITPVAAFLGTFQGFMLLAQNTGGECRF